MINQRIYLTEDKRVYFDTYIISNSVEMGDKKKRPAIIICPGGGYEFTSDREAEPIALSYASKGYHAFVLRYSCLEDAKMPAPLEELAKTMSYVRTHSEEWCIEKDLIFVTGFSAGAHLAACLGVFWNNKEMLTEYEGRREEIKPNGMILCYPVLDLASSTHMLDIGVTGYPDYKEIDCRVHKDADLEKIYVRKDGKTYVNFEQKMNAFIFGGTEYTKEQEDFYSLQNQVTKDTPPTFIWHTSKDDLILPSNSLLFATALNKNQIPYELHIFGEGGHGKALANEITAVYPWDICKQCEPWLDLANTWIKTMVEQKRAKQGETVKC